MNKISSAELFWLMFMLYGSPYSLIMMHYLTQSSLLGTMVLLLLAGIVAQIILYLVLSWGKKEPSLRQNSFGVMAKKFFWRLYFFFSALLNAAALTEMISAEFLNLTPKWLLALFFIVPTAYLAQKKRRNIVWLAVILLPLSFLGYGALFLGNATKFSLINILPVQMIWDNFSFAFWRLLPFCAQALALGCFYPEFGAPKQALKAASAALWANIALLFGEYLLACGVFGAAESRRILFIPVELARTMQIGNAVLRVEAFSVWHWSVVGVLSTALFLHGLGLKDLRNDCVSLRVILLGGGLIVGILSVFDDLVALNFLATGYFGVTAAVLGGLIFLKAGGRREK